MYRYVKYLDDAKRSGIKKGAFNGLTIGVVWCLIYCAYGLGMSYIMMNNFYEFV